MYVVRTGLRRAIATAMAVAAVSAAATPAPPPIAVLFVGNSYTFGRVDPVMRFNAGNVHDLTAGFYAADPAGANPWEPHPWGGVPGIFKAFTVEQGLDYDVSISARNAASLRGHFLDTANAAWDLRGNVASKRWDVVVLQEQSDGALPVGSGKNANPARFRAYADKFEQFIHTGAAHTYTETALYGSVEACTAGGESAAACAAPRTIPANPHANPAARIFLTETWARPDMVYAHRVTTADKASPAGSPVPAAGGAEATLYYRSLAAMTADLHAAIYGEAQANGKFVGVAPVGEAFQLAYDEGLVKSGGFYNADGVFAPNGPHDLMNLWWDDYLHASKFGSYLAALVQYGTITGRDPRGLGGAEAAAHALGIPAGDAAALQSIAAQALGMRGTARPAPHL